MTNNKHILICDHYSHFSSLLNMKRNMKEKHSNVTTVITTLPQTKPNQTIYLNIQHDTSSNEHATRPSFSPPDAHLCRDCPGWPENKEGRERKCKCKITIHKL